MKRILFSVALGLGTLATFASCQRMAQQLQAWAADASDTDEATYTHVDEGKSQQGGTRNVGRLPRFVEVSVSNGITLKYVPNGQPSITVKTSRIDPASVVFHVHDGELTITYPDHKTIRNEQTVVTITGHSIREFELSNGGRIDIATALNVRGKLSFQVNNGGTISVPGLKAGDVDVEVNNGGMVTIANANASKLDADVNNGGDIKVNNAQLGKADVEISNGGTVTLVGTATNGELQVNNGGSLKAENLRCKRASIEVNNGGTLHYNAQQVVKHEVVGGGTARNYFK